MIFGITLKSSIFPDGQRPTKENFWVIIGYPEQSLRARIVRKNWRKIEYANYTMRFGIQNMVVLRRRSTGKTPCHDDWRNDDSFLMKRVVEDLGCVPALWPINTTLPRCWNEKQFELLYTMSLDKYEKACRSPLNVLKAYVWSRIPHSIDKLCNL